MAHHGHALDCEAERECRVPLGVDPAVLQDLRMHHAGPEELDPAVAAHRATRPVALEARHGHLAAGLDEREVVGVHPDPAVRAEQRASEGLERPLEVGERDPLVDGQRLDLEQQGEMGGADGLPPVRAPGREDVDGRVLRLHRPDLHGGGLGAKEEPGDLDVEGVLHGPGGVVGGDVEGLEVVPVVLDLRAFLHAVAHAGEDPDHLVLDDREGMQRSRPQPAAGKRDVDPIALEQASLFRPGQCSTPFVQRRLQGLAQLVRRHPQALAVLRVERAQRTLDLAEPGLPAEHPHLCGVERLRGVRAGDHRQAPLAFLVEDAPSFLGVHGCLSLARGPAQTGSFACPAGTSRRNRRPPSAISTTTVPPCASATPLATNNPILLPAPLPGARGSNSWTAVSGVSSVPARKASSTSRPSVLRAVTRMGPSPAHHTSASTKASRTSCSRSGSRNATGRSGPSHTTGGRSGSRAADWATFSTRAATSTRSGYSSRASPTTRAASTNCRTIMFRRSVSYTIPWSISVRCSSAIWSHRVASAYPNPFIAVSGERMSCAAEAMTDSSATRRPSRSWRAHSNRHTVAAAARFRDSARPRMGTRTVASARDATSGGSPHASLPNRNVVGRVRSSSYRSASPPASMA